MTMRPFLVMAGLAALTLLPRVPAARAEGGIPGAAGLGGFRCGTGRVIRNGETQGQISRKCGEPDSTRTWSESQIESVWVNGRRVERQVIVTYDEWEYDLGPHKLVRFLTFVQGQLIRVTTGGYGS